MSFFLSFSPLFYDSFITFSHEIKSLVKIIQFQKMGYSDFTYILKCIIFEFMYPVSIYLLLHFASIFQKKFFNIIKERYHYIVEKIIFENFCMDNFQFDGRRNNNNRTHIKNLRTLQLFFSI